MINHICKVFPMIIAPLIDDRVEITGPTGCKHVTQLYLAPYPDCNIEQSVNNTLVHHDCRKPRMRNHRWELEGPTPQPFNLFDELANGSSSKRQSASSIHWHDGLEQWMANA
jgi:hypothetical protein